MQEEGPQLVPFEHRNSSTAKQVVVCREEKEVLSAVTSLPKIEEGPLPLSAHQRWTTRWASISLKYRMMCILVAQITTLLSLVLVIALIHRKNFIRCSNSIAVDSPQPFTIDNGLFLISPEQPRKQTSSCLSSNNEAVVWTCNMSSPMLQLSILPALFDGLANGTLLSIHPLDTRTRYGLQPFQVEPTRLSEVPDPDFANCMAYHFRTKYDRRVLLAENELLDRSEQVISFSKGSSDLPLDSRPWSCSFNQTQIEGYIYRTLASLPLSGNSTMSRDSLFKYRLVITERRVPNSPQPVCEQMNMTSNGLDQLVDKDGFVTIVRLNETSQGEECSCEWVIG